MTALADVPLSVRHLSQHLICGSQCTRLDDARCFTVEMIKNGKTHELSAGVASTTGGPSVYRPKAVGRRIWV